MSGARASGGAGGATGDDPTDPVGVPWQQVGATDIVLTNDLETLLTLTGKYLEQGKWMPLSVLQGEAMHMGTGLDLIQAALDAPPELGKVADEQFRASPYGLSLVTAGRKAMADLPSAIAHAVTLYESQERSVSLRKLKRTLQLNGRAGERLAAVLDSEGMVMVPVAGFRLPTGAVRRRWRITDEVRHYTEGESLGDYLSVRSAHPHAIDIASPRRSRGTRKGPSRDHPWRAAVGVSLRQLLSSTAVRVALFGVSAVFALVLPTHVENFVRADGLDPIASRCVSGSVPAEQLLLRIHGQRWPIRVVLQRSTRCDGEWAWLQGHAPAEATIRLAVTREVDGLTEPEAPGHSHVTLMLSDTMGCVRGEVDVSYRGERARADTHCAR